MHFSSAFDLPGIGGSGASGESIGLMELQLLFHDGGSWYSRLIPRTELTDEPEPLKEEANERADRFNFFGRTLQTRVEIPVSSSCGQRIRIEER
jgi:hypothetical protein